MSNSLAEVHPELIADWSEKDLPLTPAASSSTASWRRATPSSSTTTG